MIKTSSFRYLRRFCALVAAALIVPAVAYAKDIQWDKWDKDIQWDKWHKGDKWDRDDKGEKGNRGERGGKGDPVVSPVPEANTVWVLVPFVGAVLLFSARDLFGREATE